MTEKEQIPVDVGRLVGLVGPGAWTMFALYSVTFTALAILGNNADPSIAVTAALAVILAAAALVAAPSPTPLPWSRIACIYAAVAISTTLVSTELPHIGHPGYTAWHFGAITFLLFAVALRARIIPAWIGMAIMITIAATWGYLATGSAWRGIEISYAQPVGLVAGTVFSLGLHTTAKRITEYTAARHRAAAQDSLQSAREARRRSELEHLRLTVEPALHALADGVLNDAARTDIGILEAELRDRIRGRTLATEPLIGIVRLTRRDGYEVLLLDDTTGDPIDGSVREDIALWAAQQLRAHPDGDSILRLTNNTDELTLTVTTAGDTNERAWPRTAGTASRTVDRESNGPDGPACGAGGGSARSR